MARTIVAGGLLALAALLAANEARGTDATPAILKKRERHEGKLVKEVIEFGCKGTHVWQFPPPRPPIRSERWVLIKADKTRYELNFDCPAWARLAPVLQGRDVVVTGPLTGKGAALDLIGRVNGKIDVRTIEAKVPEFTGLLARRPLKCLPIRWVLVTDRGELNLRFKDEAAAEACRKWDGKRVVAKGRLTLRGISVTSVER